MSLVADMVAVYFGGRDRGRLSAALALVETEVDAPGYRRVAIRAWRVDDAVAVGTASFSHFGPARFDGVWLMSGDDRLQVFPLLGSVEVPGGTRWESELVVELR